MTLGFETNSSGYEISENLSLLDSNCLHQVEERSIHKDVNFSAALFWRSVRGVGEIDLQQLILVEATEDTIPFSSGDRMCCKH